MLVFLRVLVPIYLIVAAGFYIGRRRQVDPATLATLLLYLFSPSLVFRSIITSNLTGHEAGIMVVFSLALTAVMGLLGAAFSRALRLDPAIRTAVLISVMVLNTGNYGASVVLLAFGAEAFSQAIVFMAIQFALSSTAALFVAARGQGDTRTALLELTRQPTVYAGVLGALARVGGLSLPEAVTAPISLLADANIPVALLLLGMHLGRAVPRAEERKAVTAAVVIRLVAGAAVGWILAALSGAGPLLRNVLIVQAAMPTAVNAITYAAEFRQRADVVGQVIITSTIASLVTISAVLVLLGA
jgi:predicted permease